MWTCQETKDIDILTPAKKVRRDILLKNKYMNRLDFN